MVDRCGGLWNSVWGGLVRLALPLALSVLSGCHEHLIVTPYLMRVPEARAIYDGLDPSLQTPEIPVLYVTDRSRALPGASGPMYTSRRSTRIAYGKARVGLDPTPTWEELVELSTSGERDRTYDLSVTKVDEVGSFTPLDALREVRDGVLTTRREGWQVHVAEVREFDAFLSEALAKTQRKEVVIFVHGFNNSFDDAVIRLAQAWHFSGREGVPLVYTWPAGGHGGLTGYGYDRESGEFTILHLKLMLRAIALCPDVEGIHIVAHSRGTDVTVTALRELNAEARGLLGHSILASLLPDGGSKEPTEQNSARAVGKLLKIKTVVLAAPDLDIEVFGQRFTGENMANLADRFVVYFSPDDAAIVFARWLMGSFRRLGALTPEDFSPQQQAMLRGMPSVELIDCNVSGFTTSHAYVFQHPSALSDLLLVLRTGSGPDPDGLRPLQQPEPGIWRMTNDYLRPNPPK